MFKLYQSGKLECFKEEFLKRFTNFEELYTNLKLIHNNFDFNPPLKTLDESLSELEIKAGLFKLENLAKTQGFAVGKIRPYPLSIRVLKEWLNGLNRKEIVVVPVIAATAGTGFTVIAVDTCVLHPNPLVTL
jgi:hypothetical protein